MHFNKDYYNIANIQIVILYTGIRYYNKYFI